MSDNQGFVEKLRTIRSEITVKVAWLGLSGAGKTTLLNRITTGLFKPDTLRTLGLDVEEFTVESVRFICWDTGGQEVFREALWKAYITGSQGILFVVDSADLLKFGEAKEELWRYVINNPDCEGVPILVLANKQDLPTAASSGIVARNLDLHLVTDHSYAIRPVSAKTGLNIEDSLQWLHERIRNNITRKEQELK